MTIVTVGNRGTTTVKRAPYAASQAQVDAGTATGVYASPSTIKNRNGDVSALTDAATIDITSDKHTLSTASNRTFTVSFVGAYIEIEITLNATSATMTFPAGSLCVSEGVGSGDNTLSLSGVSGDLYLVSLRKKTTGGYFVAGKNFLQ